MKAILVFAALMLIVPGTHGGSSHFLRGVKRFKRGLNSTFSCGISTNCREASDDEFHVQMEEAGGITHMTLEYPAWYLDEFVVLNSPVTSEEGAALEDFAAALHEKLHDKIARRVRDACGKAYHPSIRILRSAFRKLKTENSHDNDAPQGYHAWLRFLDDDTASDRVSSLVTEQYLIAQNESFNRWLRRAEILVEDVLKMKNDLILSTAEARAYHIFRNEMDRTNFPATKEIVDRVMFKMFITLNNELFTDGDVSNFLVDLKLLPKRVWQKLRAVQAVLIQKSVL